MLRGKGAKLFDYIAAELSYIPHLNISLHMRGGVTTHSPLGTQVSHELNSLKRKCIMK